jgi:hypothetical protein
VRLNLNVVRVLSWPVLPLRAMWLNWENREGERTKLSLDRFGSQSVSKYETLITLERLFNVTI